MDNFNVANFLENAPIGLVLYSKFLGDFVEFNRVIRKELSESEEPQRIIECLEYDDTGSLTDEKVYFDEYGRIKISLYGNIIDTKVDLMPDNVNEWDNAGICALIAESSMCIDKVLMDKFESDSKTGEYDIILDITSFRDLIKEGWVVKYNKEEGKKKYLQKKDEPTIVVGVIGNGNKGKSFILEKLSGYEIPKGFNVKTIGLSIRYGTSKEHNVAILDSAGQETPLLKMEKENLIEEKKEESNEIISENDNINAN